MPMCLELKGKAATCWPANTINMRWLEQHGSKVQPSRQRRCASGGLRFGFDGPGGGHAEQLLHQSRLASVSSKVQRCVACTVLLIYICPLS